MTPEEKFMFDLQGFLVVKNVLSGDEVAELNEISDRSKPDEYETYQEDGLKIARRVSQWSPACQNLFDHPKLAPYLVGLVGPKVRVDALTPARKGDGDFCCVPGSHKSNFILDIPRHSRIRRE
jgi:hypothetical protein